MDNGMTKEQAMSAAAFDVFAKQPILEGAKGGAIAAVMSIPGTAGAIRAGETLGGRAAVADEQGTFKTVRAMEAGPAAQAQAVKTNIANGLATLEQANARLAKQGGIANKTAFKTDAANNTLMDYNTNQGSAEIAYKAFRDIANEAIASGKLTAQEVATLQEAVGQSKVYVDAMALLGDNGIGGVFNVKARTFTSPDKYVGETATAIESEFPGRVVAVNKKVYKPDGSPLTDFDVELDNIVIQVKSGSGRGLTPQMQRTATGTSKKVIGYAPDLNPSSALVRGARKVGFEVFTTWIDLLNYLKKN